jgi:GT2 family glycosyltransferase
MSAIFHSSPARPTVSAIVCAHLEERWDDLVAAIGSLRRQTVPAQEIILVVDHQPALLARARQSLPGARVVENREAPGLSGARNTGVAVSQGEALAFLDDDAAAAPDWLEQLLRWFADDTVAGAGGRVDPRWAAPRPRWFPPEFQWVVGCSYQGLPEAGGPVRNLFGGCMLVRRAVFEQAGGFRGGLGRAQGRPMGGEETEFCIRAQQRQPGWRFIYEPRARAMHRVPRQRMAWSYFRARCYAEGLSKAQVSALVGSGAGLAAERAYTWRTLPRGLAGGLARAARGDPSGLLCSGAILAGLGFTLAGFGAGLLTHRAA